MTSLNHIRDNWFRRLAPWAIFVWLAVALTPCVCAIAQAQTTEGHALQTTGAHHEHCDESGSGTSGVATDCCDNLVVRAAVDGSDRFKLPEVLPSSFMPEPAVVRAFMPAASSLDEIGGPERAPPVYLATRRLRI